MRNIRLQVMVHLSQIGFSLAGKIEQVYTSPFGRSKPMHGLCRFGMRVLRVVDLKFIICIFDFGLQRFFENRKCRNETITYQ